MQNGGKLAGSNPALATIAGRLNTTKVFKESTNR